MNTLLRTDVYKMGHMEQYVPGTNYVYSYLCARNSKEFSDVTFFGLQYYLYKYLSSPITKSHGEEFIKYRNKILGGESKDVNNKIQQLCQLGYWPIRIRAIPEGMNVPIGNILMSVESTHPDFYWCVGFIESLLLKVWYPSTVATRVRKYRTLINRLYELTSDNHQIKNWCIHDFGYRSDTSEESAGISGAAHLIYFNGSDTIVAYPTINKYYPNENQINNPNDTIDYSGLVMGSVPATEHSVMCSYGLDGELKAFERMLELYPSGIVSIVSDTYDIWHVCTNYLPKLKDRILARDGKVVIRPDSGDPLEVICGNNKDNSPAGLGVLRLLDKEFGHDTNSKGFKVLNSKIGLIYGDGMYYDRYESILNTMTNMGYAAENLIVGIGGILRSGSRDTLGFALKATHVEVNGAPRNIMKNPVTDKKKISHCGFMKLVKKDDTFYTEDRISKDEMESCGLIPVVFENGVILKHYSFDQIKANANLC